MIEDIVLFRERNLSKYVENSIIKICDYLKLDIEILVSSNIKEYIVQDYEENVIYINKLLKADTYINATAGRELYSRIKFEQNTR